MTEAYAEQMTQAQSIKNPYFVGQCQKVTGAQLLNNAKSYSSAQKAITSSCDNTCRICVFVRESENKTHEFEKYIAIKD